MSGTKNWLNWKAAIQKPDHIVRTSTAIAVVEVFLCVVKLVGETIGKCDFHNMAILGNDIGNDTVDEILEHWLSQRLCQLLNINVPFLHGCLEDSGGCLMYELLIG